MYAMPPGAAAPARAGVDLSSLVLAGGPAAIAALLLCANARRGRGSPARPDAASGHYRLVVDGRDMTGAAHAVDVVDTDGIVRWINSLLGDEDGIREVGDLDERDIAFIQMKLAAGSQRARSADAGQAGGER